MTDRSPAHVLALFRAGFNTAEIAERLGLYGSHPDVHYRVRAAYPWTCPEARPDEAYVCRLLAQARAEERARRAGAA